MGMVPILRYIPSRHLMQRLIRRAAALHPDFTSFDGLTPVKKVDEKSS